MRLQGKCPAKRRHTPVYKDDDVFKTLADRVQRIELLIAFILGSQLLTIGARVGELVGWWS